jgi:hypothetical protein
LAKLPSLSIQASKLPSTKVSEHLSLSIQVVTDLQGPLSEQAENDKLAALKRCAQEFTRDQWSWDDTQISYLETLEQQDQDNLTLAQMIAR